MDRTDVFLIWFVICFGWSIRAGGAAEQIAALLQLCALALSRLQGWLDPHHYDATLYEVWAIDTLLFVALYVLALRANRFWPMWLAAMQLQSVLAHLARAIDLQMLPVGYFAVVNLMAWPMIALTTVGAVRHFDRLKRYGSDPSFI